MNKRLRTARRVLAAQVELDRLAEWKLIDLERQDAALQERRRDLVRFLDGESALGGLFAVTMMRRLQGLEEQRAVLVAETQAQAALRRDERGRMRGAERIVESLERQARQIEEAHSLAEAIEFAIKPPA